MVAIVNSGHLGVHTAESRQGAPGTSGSGRSPDQIYVNTSTGNLVVQQRDERLASAGLDLALIRTYNSLGLMDDDNGDNWRFGVHQRIYGLTGTLNAANSTVRKVFGDGADVLYTYDVARQLYISTDGSGAHDTLRFDASTTQWIWTEESSYVEIYDSSGRLIRSEDADGNAVTYGYSGTLLNSITDASGQTTTLVYSGNNLVEISVSSPGQSQPQTRTRYFYDSLNRLSQVAVDLTPGDATNDTVALPDADGDGLYEGINQRAYVTTYSYVGATKLVSSITQGDGTRLSFTYEDGTDRIRTYRYGVDRETTLTYFEPTPGTPYRRTEVRNLLGEVTTYAHDDTGRLRSIVDAAGRQTVYSYDADGNISEIAQDPTGLNRRTTFRYDVNGNLRLTRDAAGNTVERTYSATNQLLAETTYLIRDPDAADQGVSPATPLTTRYTYDNEDHLRFVVSAEGRVTEHRYDGIGQRMATLVYRAVSYTGLEFTESALQQWVDLQTPQSLATVERVDYAYDFRGLLRQSTAYGQTDNTGAGVSATAAITRFVYDQRGQLLQTITPRGSATSPDGETTSLPYATTFAYDGLGRVTSTTRWVGPNEAPRVTSFMYDDAGNRVVTTLHNGANTLETTSVYNAAGDLLAVIDIGQTSGQLSRKEYAYDNAGRLRSVTDAASGIRHYRLYDAAGLQTAEIDGDGSLTEYVYNRLGQEITRVRYADRVSADALAGLATGTLQTLDQLTQSSTTFPTGRNPDNDHINRTVYDAAGNVRYVIDDVGAVTEYIYDGANRVTETVKWGIPLSLPRTVGELLIAAANQLVDVSSGSTYSLTPSAIDRRARNFYDGDGRLVGTLDAAGYLVEYAYDNAGRLTGQTAYSSPSPVVTGNLADARPLPDLTTADDPEQDIVTYFFYDGLGRQTGVLDGEGYLTEVQYDADSNVSRKLRYDYKLTYGAGATLQSLIQGIPIGTRTRTTGYQYNGAGQITSETNFEGTVAEYRYDQAGNLTHNIAASGDSADARTRQVEYDELGRIKRELSGEGSAQIAAGLDVATAWDHYGISYAYDQSGRRTSSTSNVYDPVNGYQLRTTYYYYNADNQLRYTVDARRQVTEHTYDAFGRLTGTIGYVTPIDAAVVLTGGADGLLAPSIVSNPAKDTFTTVEYAYLSSGPQRREVKTTTAEGAQTTEQFDVFGQVTRRFERIRHDGTTTTDYVEHRYTYDKRGLLDVTSWDPTGINRTEDRNYDAFGRLTSVVDQYGNRTRAEYDRLGRSIVTYDALNIRRRTAYDAFSRVIDSYDAFDNRTRYEYDDAQRTVRVTTPEGISVTTTYNRHGQTVDVESGPEGARNTTHYRYNADGQVIHVSDDLGSLESRNYDSAGRQVAATDANGVVTRFEYDAANRTVRRVVDYGGLALTTSYTYDDLNRAMDVVNDSGVRTRTTYDRDGRVYEVTVDPDGDNRSTTRYTYDDEGRAVLVWEGMGVNPNWRRTRYVYDRLGRLAEKIVDPSDIGGTLNLRTQYKYDANGNLTRKIEDIGDVTAPVRQTRSTWYVYDANQRLEYSVDALGGVTRNIYDDEGRVRETWRYAGSTSTSGFGDIVQRSQIAPTGDVASHRVERFYYDRDGREIYTINALGGVTQRDYDANGNVVRTVVYARPLSSPPSSPSADAATVAAVYWGANAPTLAADDRVQWTVYDKRDQAVYTVDAYGGVVRNEYDNVGNVVKSTAYAASIALSAGAQIVSSPIYSSPLNASASAFTVDAMNNWADSATVAGDTANRTTRYWYDAAGRVRFKQDAEGYLTEMRYNHVTRRDKTIVYAGKATISPAATLNDLERCVGGAAVVGVIIPVDDSVDQKTVTHYDSAGRVSSTVDARGGIEYYGYDAVGNKVWFTNKKGSGPQDPNATWRYEYDANGRLTREITPAVAVTTVSQSGAGLHSDTNPSLRLETVMKYDALGNVIERTEAANTSQARTTSYEYDALGRQTITRFPPVEVYNYDSGVAETDYSLYTQVTYDTLGNATANRDVDGRMSYKVYDALGRAKYDIDALGYFTRYDYDTFGNERYITRYDTNLRPVPSMMYGHISAEQVETAIAAQYIVGNDNRTIEKRYDRLNRVTHVIEPRVYTFDSGAPAGSQYGYANPVTAYQYNAFGQVTRESHLIHGIGVGSFDPDAAPGAWANTYYYYDRRGLKAAEVIAAELATAGYASKHYLTTYSYDETGDLTGQHEYARALRGFVPSTAMPAPPAAGTVDTGYDRETTFAYDQLNRKTLETRVNIRYSNEAGVQSIRDLETKYGYDALGNQTSVGVRNVAVESPLAPDAWITTYSYYDVLGRVIAIAAPRRHTDGDNAASAVTPYTEMHRDAYGNIVKQVQYAGDVGPLSAGDMPPVIDASLAADPQNRVSLYRFDRHGRIAQTAMAAQGGSAVSLNDAAYAVRHAAYTRCGEIAREWQTIQTVNPNAAAPYITETLSTTYHYDALGRQTQLVEPQSDSETRTTESEYNAFGEITVKRVRNAAGVFSLETFDYDKAGRVWRTNADDGVYRIYLFDLAGRATAEIKSQGRNFYDNGVYHGGEDAAHLTTDVVRTETVYDLLGRVLEQREPSFGVLDSSVDPIRAQFQISTISMPVPPEAIYYENAVSDPKIGTSTFYLVGMVPWVDGGGWYVDASGNMARVPQSEFRIAEAPYLRWDPPSRPGVSATFTYRAAGSSDPLRSLTVRTTYDSQWGVDLTGLTGGTYEYELAYWRDGVAYEKSIGTFTVDTPTTTTTLGVDPTPIQVAPVSAYPGYENWLYWAAPSDPSISVAFNVRPTNTSGWTPASIIPAGESMMVDIGGYAAGTWDYEITYTRNGAAVAVATGMFYSSGPSDVRNVGGASVTANPAPPPAQPITDVYAYYTTVGTEVWWYAADPYVTATLEISSNGGSTWQSYEASQYYDEYSGYYFYVQGLTQVPGAYTYRVTHYADGQMVATASGALTIDGGSTTITTALSVTPIVDPASTVGTITAYGGVLYWSAAAIDVTATVYLQQGGTTLQREGFAYYDDYDTGTRYFYVDLGDLGPGTWQYQLSHTRGGAEIARAEGSFSTTGFSQPRQVSGPSVTANPAPPPAQPITDVYAYYTTSGTEMWWVTGDPSVTATVELSSNGGSTWQSYNATQYYDEYVGYWFYVQGMTQTPGAYVYRITHYAGGQMVATATGSLTIDGGSTTVTTGLSVTPIVDPASTVGSITAYDSVLYWSAAATDVAATVYLQQGGTSLQRTGVAYYNDYGTNTRYFYVDLGDLGAGSWQYQISHTRGGTEIARAEGSFSTTGFSQPRQISGTSVTANPAPPPAQPITDIYAYYGASATEMYWFVSDPSLTGKLEISSNNGATWQSYNATLYYDEYSGYYFYVSGVTQTPGSYTYRVTHYSGDQMVATATGTLTVTGSSSSTSLSGFAPTPPWETVAAVSGAVQVTPATSASITAYGYQDYALLGYDPFKGFPIVAYVWVAPNQVTFSDTGGGTRVLLEYYNASGGYASIDQPLSGASVTWSDDFYAPAGGISSVIRARIYDANGMLVRDTAGSSVLPRLQWTSAPHGDVAFSYKLAGSSSWTSVTPTLSGGQWLANMPGLGAGTYDYQVVYYDWWDLGKYGSGLFPSISASGQFVFNGSAVSVTSQVSSPAAPLTNVSTGGTNLYWSAPLSGGDSLSVTYYNVYTGASGSLSYSTGNNVDFSANLAGMPSGTYSYSITYSRGGVPYLQASGSITVTTSVTYPQSVASSPSTHVEYSASNIVPWASGDTLYWNYPSGSGISTALTYQLPGQAAQTVYFVGYDTSRSFQFSMVTGNQSVAIPYTITYTNTNNNTTVARGSGVFRFTVSTPAIPGILSQPSQTAVYPSVPGVGTFTDLGGGVLAWSEPASGGAVEVRYRQPAGSGNWSGWQAASAYGSGYSYNFNSLDGVVEYEIRYVVSGQNPYRRATGTVTVTHTTHTVAPSASASFPSSHVEYSASNIVPWAVGDTLYWNYPSGPGTSVELSYQLPGGSVQTVGFIGYDWERSFQFSMVTGDQTVAIPYTITYKNTINNTPIARGSGVFRFTVSTPAIPGTLSQPSQTAVYPSVPGVGTFADLGGGVLAWSEPATGGAVEVRYRQPVGSGNWSGWQAASAYGSGYSYNFNSLDGVVEYEIRYVVSGQNPYRRATGTLTVTHTTHTVAPSAAASPPSTRVEYSASNVVPWAVGDTLYWNYPSGPGTSVALSYQLPGQAAQTVYFIGYDTSRSFQFSMVTGDQSVAIPYTITYTNTTNNTPIARGSGVFRFTVTNTHVNATASSTAQNDIRGFVDQGGSVLRWDTLPVDGAVALFRYKQAGTSDWQGAYTPSLVSGHMEVDLSQLSGTIEYEITYTRPGSSNPYNRGVGSVQISRSTQATGSVAENTLAGLVVSTATPTRKQEVDRWGNVLHLTDTAGHTTDYSYNQMDQVTRVVQPMVDVLDTRGGIVDSSRTRPVAYNYYDIYGRLVATVDPTTQYNPATYELYSANFKNATYNEVGQVLTESHLDDNNGGVRVAKRHAYDAFGQQVQTIDEMDYKSRRRYDVAGNLTGLAREIDRGAFIGGPTTFPAVERDNLNYVVYEYGYDEAGRRVSETSGEFIDDSTSDIQETTRYWYDLHGNLVRKREPRGSVFESTYGYDVNGKKILETDANGSTMSWVYDGFGRLRSHQQLTNSNSIYAAAQGDTIYYDYNRAGLLRHQESVYGQRIDYRYDEAGHLILIEDRGSQWNGPVTLFGVNRDTSYRYDQFGRRIRERVVIDGVTHQNAVMTYDELNRLDSVTDIRSRVEYSYDARGNRSRISAAFKDNQSADRTQDLWYVYDSMNRVKISQGVRVERTPGIFEVAAEGQEAVVLNYDARGNRIYSSQYGTTLTYQTHSYMEQTNPGSVEPQFAEITTSNWYEIAGQDQWRYTYDGLSRLVRSDRVARRLITAVDLFLFPGETQVLRDSEFLPNEAGFQPVFVSRSYDRASRETLKTSRTLVGTNSFDLRDSVSDYDDNGRLRLQTSFLNGVEESEVVYGDAIYRSAPIDQTFSYQKLFPRAGYRTVTYTVRLPAGWSAGFDAAGVLRGYTVRVYNTSTAATDDYRYQTLNAFHYRLGDSYQETSHTATSLAVGVNGQPPPEPHTIPLPGSTNRIYNINGELVAFNDPNVNMNDTERRMNNRLFATNAAGQVLTAIGGVYQYNPISNAGLFAGVLEHTPASPTGMIASQLYRYADGQYIGTFGLLQGGDDAAHFTANFDVNFEPISDNYPAPVPAQVTIQAGDTLRSIAQRIYGDGSLWYVLADANGLTDNPDVELSDKIGWSLRVPNSVVSNSNDASSFKPFNPTADALSDTTPHQPMPPPPQADKKGCGIIGTIIVIVVAIVVSVVSYGSGSGWAASMASSILGSGASATATTALAMGIAAAAGSVVSQLVGITIGVQDKFNWKSVAVAAITAGITQGTPIGQIGSKIAGSSQIVSAAIQGAVNSAVSQGINIAVGLQKKFDWKGLAAAAISAPVSQSINFGKGSVSKILSDFTSGVASGAIRGAFQGKIDFAQVAADAFGNAIGNSIAVSIMSSQTKSRSESDDLVVTGKKGSGSSNPQSGDATGPLTKDEIEHWKKNNPTLLDEKDTFEAENELNKLKDEYAKDKKIGKLTGERDTRAAALNAAIAEGAPADKIAKLQKQLKNAEEKLQKRIDGHEKKIGRQETKLADLQADLKESRRIQDVVEKWAIGQKVLINERVTDANGKVTVKETEYMIKGPDAVFGTVTDAAKDGIAYAFLIQKAMGDDWERGANIYASGGGFKYGRLDDFGKPTTEGRLIVGVPGARNNWTGRSGDKVEERTPTLLGVKARTAGFFHIHPLGEVGDVRESDRDFSDNDRATYRGIFEKATQSTTGGTTPIQLSFLGGNDGSFDVFRPNPDGKGFDDQQLEGPNYFVTRRKR